MRFHSSGTIIFSIPIRNEISFLMASVLGITDYVIIGIMMTVSAGVGIYFRFTGGKQKTALEFLMADKNMSILPVSFSIFSTSMSAIAVLGLPSEYFLYGTQILIKDFSCSIMAALATYYVLPIYFEMNTNSVYEYMGRRFGRSIKIITSLLFSVQMKFIAIGWVNIRFPDEERAFFFLMILYMPLVLYAPSLALSTVTGLSVWTSVISMSLICTFYSTLGGLKAILWTDLFQAILMIFAIYALIIKGTVDLGGFREVFDTAKRGQRLQLLNTSTDFQVRYTFWNTILIGIILGVYINSINFSIVQRLLSCGDLKKAQCSLLWSILWNFVFQLGVCLLGATMYSYYSECDPVQNKEIGKMDQLVPFFMLKLFGDFPGLPGLCIAGIFSGALSTMSSVINSLAAITLEDYLKLFKICNHLKESTISLIVKILAVFYGGLCLLLTVVAANAKSILEASTIVVGLVAGPTVGVFCLGMFTSTANEPGTIIGLMAGFSSCLWTGLGSLYYRWKYPPLPLSTAGCLYNNSTEFDAISKENITLNMNIYSTILPPDEGYILPLYKISYMWHSTMGFLATYIVGYTASCIIGLWKPKRDIDPKLFSPAVRKWLKKKSSTRNEKIEYVELPQRLPKEKE